MQKHPLAVVHITSIFQHQRKSLSIYVRLCEYISEMMRAHDYESRAQA